MLRLWEYLSREHAMKVEFDALVKNNNGLLCQNNKPISSKWVFRVKLKSDSTLDK